MREVVVVAGRGRGRCCGCCGGCPHLLLLPGRRVRLLGRVVLRRWRPRSQREEVVGVEVGEVLRLLRGGEGGGYLRRGGDRERERVCEGDPDPEGRGSGRGGRGRAHRLVLPGITPVAICCSRAGPGLRRHRIPPALPSSSLGRGPWRRVRSPPVVIVVVPAKTAKGAVPPPGGDVVQALRAARPQREAPPVHADGDHQDGTGRAGRRAQGAQLREDWRCGGSARWLSAIALVDAKGARVRRRVKPPK